MRISSRIVATALACLSFALPAAADRAAGTALVPGAPHYFRLEPIFIPVIQGDRVTRQVGLTLMLQLKKGEKEKPIESKRRQLESAFVEDLYAFFAQRADLHHDIDEAYLKHRLLEVADAVIGAKAVKEVLIEQLLVTRE